MKLKSQSKRPVVFIIPLAMIALGAFFYFYSGQQDPNHYICVGTGQSITISKIENKDVLVLNSSSEANKQVGLLENGVLTVQYRNQQDLEKIRFALNQACKNKEGKILFDSITEVIEKEVQ